MESAAGACSLAGAALLSDGQADHGAESTHLLHGARRLASCRHAHTMCLCRDLRLGLDEGTGVGAAMRPLRASLAFENDLREHVNI